VIKETQRGFVSLVLSEELGRDALVTYGENPQIHARCNDGNAKLSILDARDLLFSVLYKDLQPRVDRIKRALLILGDLADEENKDAEEE